METIYKNFTIKEDYRNPYSNKPDFAYYPSSGREDDAELIGDDWVYCGNCKWADTLEDAQAEIDELLTETI